MNLYRMKYLRRGEDRFITFAARDALEAAQWARRTCAMMHEPAELRGVTMLRKLTAPLALPRQLRLTP